MNFYSFHIGDYATHTAHLDPLEDLAYRRMLDLYYLRECPLPREADEVARLIRMRANQECVEAVLSEFFTLTDEGWMNARCASDIAKMQDKQAKARASAAASVNARSTNAQRTLNECSTNAELPIPIPIPIPIPEPIKDFPQAAAKKTKTKLSEDLELPDDWKQSALDHWQKKNRPDLIPEEEFEKFKSHHVANGSRMEQWSAAWRTWYSNAVQFTKPSGIIQTAKQPYKPQWFPGIGLD